jgi:DNA-binding response OmpR family regulator
VLPSLVISDQDLQRVPCVRHILIAEDDDSLREALREALTLEGFEVRVAVDAVEACHAVAESAPDIIVSDVHMRGHGFSVARKGKELHVPVILISGVDEPRAREEALAAGAFAYLRKPIEIRELRAMIDDALDGRGTSA